jgi:hypothetical protein
LKYGPAAVALILTVLFVGSITVVIFTETGVPSGVEVSEATFSGNIEYEGESRFHSIRVGDNAVRMHCILNCGGSDFDLYGAFHITPTMDSYDFQGYDVGGEDLYYENPQSGIWNLMVYSYEGIGHYDLVVTIEYS